MLITSGSYSSSDIITIKVAYDWIGSPHKDYTVKIYSKHASSTLTKDGNTNKLYADGQQPTEFGSCNTYTGMHTDCSRYNGTSSGGNCGGGGGSTTDGGSSNAPTTSGLTEHERFQQRMKDTEIKSFSDVINKCANAEEFFTLIWYNPWSLFVWFHWW